jgi:hypothetical protein
VLGARLPSHIPWSADPGGLCGSTWCLWEHVVVEPRGEDYTEINPLVVAHIGPVAQQACPRTRPGLAPQARGVCPAGFVPPIPNPVAPRH